MRKPYCRSVPTSEARLRLTAHLHRVKQLQTTHDDACAQWRRLQWIKDEELRWQKKLDAVKARDAREMAEQLVNPTGLHFVADHEAQGKVEWELNRARREADVARACEPDVNARQAEAGQALADAQRQTLPLAAAVLIDEAKAIASEITEDTVRLRAKHARVQGLRRYLADAQLFGLLTGIPAVAHPDTIFPENPETNREAA